MLTIRCKETGKLVVINGSMEIEKNATYGIVFLSRFVASIRLKSEDARDIALRDIDTALHDGDCYLEVEGVVG